MLIILTQLVLTPPLAIVAIAAHFVRPGAEIIPRVGRVWARILLRIGGVTVVVRGAEILERNRPAVVVGNHTSFMDVYVAAHVLPQPIRFVAKASLFKIPLFGQAIRAAGFVPLQRTGEPDDIERLEVLQRDLARGAVVIFFPEGTRSRDGRLIRFKKGAFATALRAGVPVIPMVLAGACRVQPRGSLAVRAGTIEVTILEPLPVDGLTFDDRDRLVAEAHRRFAESLPPQQQPRPAESGPGRTG